MAAPTGAGKTTAMASTVSEIGKTCWLADRKQDVIAATAAIEQAGGEVGHVLPLDGRSPGPRGELIPNCLHPGIIELWQTKGYSYRPGFCSVSCARKGEADDCPFLGSIEALASADTIVTTKAMARRKGFFSAMGNAARETVVLDEDPIGLLRPPVEVTRTDLEAYTATLAAIVAEFDSPGLIAAIGPEGLAAARREAEHSRRVAQWAWDVIARQGPIAPHEAAGIPAELKPVRPILEAAQKAAKIGRRLVQSAFYKKMRGDPHGTVRNVHRDLGDLASRAVGRTAFATSRGLLFHLRIAIPKDKKIFVLDATANVDLLRPVFAPRPVEVVCDDRVRPVGRIVQFMEANFPRSSLTKDLEAGSAGTPPRVLRIIDAIGEQHPTGPIVLISYMTFVEGLAKASAHASRIKTAYFGAVRGRNDLERAAAYVVIGSPKGSEESRQQLALAVYGKSIIPFPKLVTLTTAVVGRVPAELGEEVEEDDETPERIWEVRSKGYHDPRMQAVYAHQVTAELTHAADRARVLIHPTTVYLVTNEPCPKFWFAEMCYAEDILDLSPGPRADRRTNEAAFEDKARELLDAGGTICGADVCRALGKDDSWGKRHWRAFLAKFGDALQGKKKFSWKNL